MKKIRPYVIGFVAGAVCMVSTSVIAANSEVVAQVFNEAFFKINDKLVYAPSDQPVINYNNRAYVPVRFVAEQLGCEVGWDVATKQVTIKHEPEVVEKVVEKVGAKIVYADADEDNSDKKVYSTLPVSKNGDGFTATVKNIIAKENTVYTDAGTKIFVKLENTSDSTRIQLIPGSTTLEVDGKKYAVNNISTNKDMGWYQDILPKDDNSDDDEYTGYMYFDSIPEDWDKATMTIEVRKNGTSKTEKEKITFNFMNKDK